MVRTKPMLDFNLKSWHPGQELIFDGFWSYHKFLIETKALEFLNLLSLKFGGTGNKDLKKCFTLLICICFLKCRWTKPQMEMNTTAKFLECTAFENSYVKIGLHHQWIGRFYEVFWQFVFVEIWVVNNP